MKKINSIKERKNFDLMCEITQYIMELEELNETILNDVQDLEEDGFYSPVTKEVFDTFPFEERWYYKYYITYHMSVLLLKYYNEGHKEVEEQLVNTLNACLSKHYLGHGYDAEPVRINYLIKLYRAGLKNILNENNEMADLFGKMVYGYRKCYASNKTRFGFDDCKYAILELLKVVDENVLFVYGTLMDGNANSHYLDNCAIIGQGEVRGYALVELNGYPGMIHEDGVVVGELYEIDEETKRRLDVLEGTQYKYSSDIVYVNDICFVSHFYEYIPEGNRNYTKSICKDNKWLNPDDYVWYACYGSNLSDERFMRYINRTLSKQPPIDSKPILLPYELYFAKHSSIWNKQGVAFLDFDTAGSTYGWKYLITAEQFQEIYRMEGAWYNQKIYLTTDDLGIDVLTFTSSYRYEDVKPSKEYLNVIKKGLKEKYELSDNEIDQYLSKTNS